MDPVSRARRRSWALPVSWTYPRSWAHAVILVTAAGLPLVAWPGLERPFSTPKLWFLIVSLIVLAPRAFVARTRVGGADGRTPATTDGARAVRLLALGWLASWTWSALLGDVVSLDALLLALATGLWAIALVQIAPDPGQLTGALVIGATGVAAVAVLQATGVDLFAMAGWIAPIAGASPRLRVYGTLGNPNFVAAVLAAAAPLTLGLIVSRRVSREGRTDGPARGRLRSALAAVALVLQLAALAATGSRAGALGLLAAAVTWLLLGLRSHGSRAGTAVALAAGLAGGLLALAFIGSSTARPLRDTVSGRFYIWQVAWPHAFDAPWAGQGPGAFELRYPTWERQARQAARQAEHASHAPAAAGDAFAGPQQHAHNDYLEALVERGLAGPVTILAVLATCFRGSWRRSARKQARATRAAPALTGALAALAALGAIACVDFPFARPTETMFFWSAVALLSLIESDEGSS